MKKYILLFTIILTGITGCGTTYYSNSGRLCVGDKGLYYQCDKEPGKLESEAAIKNDVSSNIGGTIFTKNEGVGDTKMAAENMNSNTVMLGLNSKLLSEYTEQMAMDLGQHLAQQRLEFPIGVASFVYLDPSLKNTNAFGNQLAEYFINELQNLGFTVSDHKITGNIEVTSKGDFAFSRNIMELQQIQNIGYVLTGTMISTDKGFIVNARVVGLNSHRVIASTSKLFPSLIFN